MIDPTSATAVQTPLSALTFIVAPALLTNATSVLAMSTINRHLRTRDRMHEMFKRADPVDETAAERAQRLETVDRVQKQGELLLASLHAIYLALAAFAGSTLVTLLGASLSWFYEGPAFQVFVGLGILLGCVGVGGLMMGSWHLFHATRISLVNMKIEADIIRRRGLPQEKGPDTVLG